MSSGAREERSEWLGAGAEGEGGSMTGIYLCFGHHCLGRLSDRSSVHGGQRKGVSAATTRVLWSHEAAWRDLSLWNGMGHSGLVEKMRLCALFSPLGS